MPRTRAERGGSSSTRPSASAARSSAVRASDANATRPGSYGSETSTSARPASASSSDHSAPVRSSKPYAKTGSPCQASSSACSRSAARRRRRSRSQRPSRSSSGAVGGVEAARSPSRSPGSSSPDSSSPSVCEQRVGEAAGARRAGEAVQRTTSASARRAISARWASRRDRPRGPDRRGDPPNRSSNVPIEPPSRQPQRGEQVALDAVDVRPVRHDQERLVVEARQIALEQQRDFARVRGPREEGESHLPIVERPRTCPAAEIGANGRIPAAGADLAGRRRPSAGGPGGRRRGPASCRRSRRRDRPPSSRGAHRVGDAQRRAARLVDFLAAVVADKIVFRAIVLLDV